MHVATATELIRADLLGADQLIQRAQDLAREQAVAKVTRRGHPLSRRLEANSRALVQAYGGITETVGTGAAITPSAEWFIDNFHVVEDQIREIRTDLPPRYYRQLPKLADGALAGYPRVFAMSWAFIAHTDSRFDPHLLTRFVAAYQAIQPLTIGELWAVPITLRIILVENLRRAADAIVARRAARSAADAVADRLAADPAVVSTDPLGLLRAHDEAPLSTAFVAQLVQRLRDQDARAAPILRWLEERLGAQGIDCDGAVNAEHHRQGTMNVTVRNIITSMRLISAMDWAEMFERSSLVDEVLRAGGDFGAMDFATRDRYRAAVETLARGSPHAEREVARLAVAHAQDAARAARDAGAGSSPRAGDPGYHLIAGGRPAFERALGFRAPLSTWLDRLDARLGIGGYAAVILVLAISVLGFALVLPAHSGIAAWQLALLGLFGLVPAIDLATSLVNRDVMAHFGATTLPGLELADGIPRTWRTLVAVPTMLTTPAAIAEQAARLEVLHLASPDGDLRFALLSDWTDADGESMPGDATLLDAAVAAIAALNSRHPSPLDGPRFLLLHRRRVRSEREGRWMGWERKRGKLHELNRLLRGATDTSFVATGGAAPAVPEGVRFVITLDADTRLPRDAARRLVGKMAHPLNRPRFDARTGRIVEGHGVLQPRVTPSLPPRGECSAFQAIFSSSSGIDPYAGAVSDVYQDLFGEGSYAGKGIYDVDAFEKALAGRVPEDTLLSHDLFEGIFARAGLVSDIEVVEAFPARYDVATSRQHRWARGDWQLLPWILGRGAPDSPRPIAAIPPIGIWKMTDNLRRTLSAPSAVLALVAGWMLPTPAALAWTAFVVATIVMPTLLPVIAGLLPRHGGISTRSHLRALAASLRIAATQSALLLTFLADQAWSMGDAIARTLYRLATGSGRMLEWLTAAQAEAKPEAGALGYVRRMAGAIGIGIGAAAAVAAIAGATGLWLALPFAAAWIASPAIARAVSRSPGKCGRGAVAPADAQALRLIARRTWRYFETFVTPADHALPPDNFQEDPKPVVARRTSPTNIGLYLLSVVAARDFGWIGTGEFLERLEATLATMTRLERHRGHFFNWYATDDLRPLDPRYVSTVDSGNLAGHLLVVAHACRVAAGASMAERRMVAGIEDALSLMREAQRDSVAHHRAPAGSLMQLDAAIARFSAVLGDGTRKGADPDAGWAELLRAAAILVDTAQSLAEQRGMDGGDEAVTWADAVMATIQSHRRDRRPDAEGDMRTRDRLATLAAGARRMVEDMEFGFLLDRERKLLSIGYPIAEGKLDPSCYDLLASEAQLASFVAIAKGDVPARHWFRLGRSMVAVGSEGALVSWSGSMFEYLMPSLVLRAAHGGLLDRSCRMAVRRQIAYGRALGIPWGISESAYSARDLEFTYQYSSFGVPCFGLKRGLVDERVVAPYATALAAMIDPAASIANFRRLAAAGAQGRYGFYEAVDYTPARLPAGMPHVVVRAYMAHHQGMSLVAIANAVLDGEMRTRFHDEPMIRATELLLQERAPRDIAVVTPRASEIHGVRLLGDVVDPPVRRYDSPHGAPLGTHLLSNGRYCVMVTAAGSGYSRWNDVAITRWREDPTCDGWGSYVLIRDVATGRGWSAGFQPSGIAADAYEAAFSEDHAVITRRDGRIATTLEILVSTEDDAEARRVTLVNGGTVAHEIEVTSFAEIVLAPADADAAHPVFSKMFVQTEFVPAGGIILATRRRRDPAEAPVWAAHLAVVESPAAGEIEIETDRARFIGRGRSLRDALALQSAAPLSGTTGTVLDPVFALRRRVRLAPGATARIAYWTIAAASREAALAAANRLQDPSAFDRAATLAWTQAQVQLRHLGIRCEEAALFQRLASHILYADPGLRMSTIRSAGQAALWAAGISGDLPIVVVRVSEMEELDVVHQVLRAHEYWRLKRLAVDLVVLNERASSYVQDVQTGIEALVRATAAQHATGHGGGGGVFALRADLIPADTRATLLNAARVVLLGRRGSISDQLARISALAPRELPGGYARPAATVAPAATTPTATFATAPALEFFNGLGGFGADGREYVTILGPGQRTPAPWINVVANPEFGFQAAAEGGGFTWSVNSRENQLTPWSNDPVADESGEAIYLRDRDSGELWSATANPIRDEAATYTTRHGHGYCRFAHTSRQIAVELLQLVPMDAAVKLSRLRIRNLSGRTRRLSVTAYAEWVLGSRRVATADHLETARDPGTGALFVTNPFRTGFGPRVAFLDMAGRQQSLTADRREFIGRNGSRATPAALAADAPLSGAFGVHLDPCAALQTRIELPPGGSVDVVVLLGEGASADGARALIARFRGIDIEHVLGTVDAYWNEVLGTVQVRTPDRAMDIMLNGWLLHQTLACRVWARAGFYQASGAYGFRDQLQDGMALVIAQPAITRAHLLRAASRQFLEGDVQHWWLPHSGQGVRTRIADDAAWLAHAVAHYVDATGDRDVLDAEVPFIDGPALRPGEHDSFYQPASGESSATLFEHCARGLDRSLAVGAHGLPLFGTGDWNDGMNRVGGHGRGESVWLAWFLHATLTSFARHAEPRGEQARATAWRTHAAALADALEHAGWDGEWYRRGFFDDGTALGSAAAAQCRIDSIAQSWAVISGAAPADRAAKAMASAERLLLRADDRLALLFVPPFDAPHPDPGYVSAYPPGLRENGGQYTHAACWMVIAWTKLGDGDRAAALFALLNPINRTTTRSGMRRYKVEPYAIAADVYSQAPHAGRGGWTWYTGSAGWLYRAGIEAILGLALEGGSLRIDPCVPRDWPAYSIRLRWRRATYEITVENPNRSGRGVAGVTLDGVAVDAQDGRIPLVDSPATHDVRVVLS